LNNTLFKLFSSQ